MSIPSCGLGQDESAVPAASTAALGEVLALLAALGWTQALFRVKETQRILGTSRASVYRDLAAGRLEAVKIGTATRVTVQSLARRIAELPPAQVGPMMTPQQNGPGCAGGRTRGQMQHHRSKIYPLIEPQANGSVLGRLEAQSGLSISNCTDGFASSRG